MFYLLHLSSETVKMMLLVLWVSFVLVHYNHAWHSNYDYIIVGGGAAGCVVATRLSEDAHISVLLLEAGVESDDPFILTPRTVFTHVTIPEINWGFSTEPQLHLATPIKVNWSQAKELGGSSSHNTMVFTRGSPHDFDRWQQLGNQGWSYSHVLPYFKKMEEMTDNPRGVFRGTRGPLKVRFADRTPISDIFLQAGVELGGVENPDYNDKMFQGYSNLQINVDSKGLRSSTLEAYLKPVRCRKNLHVITEAFVTKIRLHSITKRALGVVYRRHNRTYSVTARHEVIVSAGTVNTPKLLMLSGIGPTNHLNSLNIPVKADLPVGNNVQDHAAITIPLDIDDNSPITIEKLYTFQTLFEYIYTGRGMWSSPGSTTFAFYSLDDQPSNDLFPYIEQAYFVPRPVIGRNFPELVESIRNGSGIIPEQVEEMQNTENIPKVVLSNTLLLHPRSRGTIRLKSTDPDDNPVIDYQYIDNQQDIDFLIEGIRVLQTLISTSTLQNAGIKPITTPIPECVSKIFDSDAYWECFIRWRTHTYQHYTSSCKMAADSTAVVDHRLRVKGIKRLRIVDASIMPEIPSGHTLAPTVMIAEKASDMIKYDRTHYYF